MELLLRHRAVGHVSARLIDSLSFPAHVGSSIFENQMSKVRKSNRRPDAKVSTAFLAFFSVSASSPASRLANSLCRTHEDLVTVYRTVSEVGTLHQMMLSQPFRPQSSGISLLNHQRQASNSQRSAVLRSWLHRGGKLPKRAVHYKAHPNPNLHGLCRV